MDRTISRDELADFFGISPSTVQDHCAPKARRRWPHLLVGGQLRFLDRHVEEIVALTERGTTAPTPVQSVPRQTPRKRDSSPAAPAATGWDLTPRPLREKRVAAS